jgi:hypothetical protein
MLESTDASSEASNCFLGLFLTDRTLVSLRGTYVGLPKRTREAEVSVQVATLKDTVKPLLLAPVGAVAVVGVFLSFDKDFGFGFPTAVLLGYTLVICYVAEFIFVVPGLAVRPSFRNPHPMAAGIYGVLVGWSLPAARWLVDGTGWESLLPAAIAGASSGLLYSVLMRRWRSKPSIGTRSAWS